MCAGCGTAVHGRSPTLSQPSSTSRPTVTCLQMGTTWYPAVTALEARAVRPRWESHTCCLYTRSQNESACQQSHNYLSPAEKHQAVEYSLCFFITGQTGSMRPCGSAYEAVSWQPCCVERWNVFRYKQTVFPSCVPSSGTCGSQAVKLWSTEVTSRPQPAASSSPRLLTAQLGSRLPPMTAPSESGTRIQQVAHTPTQDQTRSSIQLGFVSYQAQLSTWLDRSPGWI